MDLPIAKIIDLIKDPDLKLKISKLVSENLELKEENFNLKLQIRDNKKIEKIEKKLVHDKNHYYLSKDNDKITPYCTNCWDSEKKLIKIHKGHLNYGVQHYSCPNCKTDTEIGEFSNP